MSDIRPFSDADRAQVIDLWTRCGLVRPWNDPNKDIDRKLTCQPEGFLVVSAQGTILGTAMFGYDGHRGMVYYLAVDPAHQRQGHAQRLMEEVEALALSWGCPKINLFVRADNTQATGFYQTLGYQLETSAAFGKRLIPDL